MKAFLSMLKRTRIIVLPFICAATSLSPARAQLGRGSDWMTAAADAQRSSWIRTDAKISPENLSKPEFKFLWKLKLGKGENTPLTVPVLLDHYIGYRGFRTLAFLSAGPLDLYAIDVDLARIEWRKQLPAGRSGNCGARIIAMARPTTAAFPSQSGFTFGFGRGGPAKGAVGEPDQGAVTLSKPSTGGFRPPRPAPRPADAPPPRPGVPDASRDMGFGFGGRPTLLYALTSDGMLHAMYVSNGDEPKPPVKFLPGGATTQGFIVSDGVAYAATQACDGVPNGVWSLDVESHEVANWEAKGAIAGMAGPAIGPDGTLYVTTTTGELAALEPQSLRLKQSYQAASAFTSSPVVLQYKDKVLVAAAARDGGVDLLDTDRLAPVSRAVASSAAIPPEESALATWQDRAGVRWLLSSAKGAVLAWKITERDGKVRMQPAWSHAMASPLPPMVINGVVFAASPKPAVLYALDGLSGNELWNSRGTITSALRGGLSGGGSQIYLGGSDGTMYVFGFYMER